MMASGGTPYWRAMETTRPRASESALASSPALPEVRMTSMGWPSRTFTVTRKLRLTPSGVRSLTMSVKPMRRPGRS
jgi:hypothetical protein